MEFQFWTSSKQNGRENAYVAIYLNTNERKKLKQLKVVFFSSNFSVCTLIGLARLCVCRMEFRHQQQLLKLAARKSCLGHSFGTQTVLRYFRFLITNFTSRCCCFSFDWTSFKIRICATLLGWMEGRGEWKKVMKILKRLFSIVYVCWVSVQKHAKVKTEIFSVCKTWCFRQKKYNNKATKMWKSNSWSLGKAFTV